MKRSSCVWCMIGLLILVLFAAGGVRPTCAEPAEPPSDPSDPAGAVDPSDPSEPAFEPEVLEISSSGALSEKERCGRVIVANETVETAVIRNVKGEREELYPGLRSEHLEAGSLVPKGLVAVVRSGRFAGYGVASDEGPSEIRADFGMHPVKRRGIAFSPAEGAMFYWMREKESGEIGSFFSGSLGTLRRFGVHTDFEMLLSRGRFYHSPEPDLAVDEYHTGKSERALRAAAGLQIETERFGRAKLFSSFSFLPALPSGFFGGGSVSGDFRFWSYTAAGDYSTPYYVYEDGDAAGETRSFSLEGTLLPDGAVGIEAGGVLRDEGVELTPNIAHESRHEVGVAPFIQMGPFELRAEKSWIWEWEVDGGGAYRIVEEVSSSWDDDGFFVEGGWSRKKSGETGEGIEGEDVYEAGLGAEIRALSCEAAGKLHCRRGDGETPERTLSVSAEVRLDPEMDGMFGDVEVYGRCSVETEEKDGIRHEEAEWEWTLGWAIDSEAVLPSRSR